MNRWLFCWCLLTALFWCASPGSAEPTPPRHVFVFVSDGWGFNQLEATTYWNGRSAVYENEDWLALAMSTYMLHEGYEVPPNGELGFTGIHGYDPLLAWSEWSYLQNYATDSAAAGTSMSTGHKTYLGSIGMGPGDGVNREVLPHFLQAAADLGYRTGTVTSVQLSHATPAAFVAHSETRHAYADIARQQAHSHLDVLMGAGHPNYDDDGAWDPGDRAVDGDWMYVGGYTQWNDLVAGRLGGDDPWTLVEEKADFESMAAGTFLPARVFGVAQAARTLQYGRSGAPADNSPEPPYTVPFVETVPSLETMTRGAINVLSRGDSPFVVVVEGGAVDWAGHGRHLGRLIEEQTDFDNAVEAAVAWVEANSSWDESLVVVTSDHETGFLWGPGADGRDPTTWFPSLVDNGAGEMPRFRFYSEPRGAEAAAGHTNEIVPFFVRGLGAELFLEYADEVDPRWGSYLDNTELAQGIFRMLGQTSVSVADPELETPDAGAVHSVTLSQNSPNPFNPSTEIRFTLDRGQKVRLDVYDVAGRRVVTLVDKTLEAGEHRVRWRGVGDDGRSVGSGVYLYVLDTDHRRLARRMTLIQ